MDSVSDLDELLDFYLMRNKKDGLDASAQLKESPILLNCQNSAALFSKVFSDKSGQAYLEYRGEHYPVKSISLAKIDYDDKETRVDVGKRLSLSDSLNQMKKYYESGELNVSTPIANAIFGYLSRFLGDENPVLVLEGLAGIGKDALTKHYCTELKNLFHDTVFYKHVTAGFDISLVDEALRMRRNYPNKSLIIHVSEGNLASYRQWCDLLTLIRADKNIKIISTQNPSEFGGRFELSHLFISKQSVKKNWTLANTSVRLIKYMNIVCHRTGGKIGSLSQRSFR